jgi:predicted nucleotidyltransferase component of viral defense system
VEILIDRRELLVKARERYLPLNMIEKDYVLGWVLFGVRQISGLVFKGGTALAKVYFPETWRLSEDLDFAAGPEGWGELPEQIAGALKEVSDKSGIGLAVKSQHSNPCYLQLKIQYSGPLGKNWLKVDVTQDPPIAKVLSKPLSRSYSDYPDFKVQIESIEEIFAQKLRALVERKKVRDYYDIWRMTQQKVDRDQLARLFAEKLKAKGITWGGLKDVFPSDLEAILSGYWEKELGRLVWPVPNMGEVVKQLKTGLNWLGTMGS